MSRNVRRGRKAGGCRKLFIWTIVLAILVLAGYILAEGPSSASAIMSSVSSELSDVRSALSRLTSSIRTPGPARTPVPTRTPRPSRTPYGRAADLERAAAAIKEAAPTGAATATRAPVPKITVKNSNMNVRSGPGTNYSIIGTAPIGSEHRIVGTNVTRDWWKIALGTGQGRTRSGWIYAPLVTATGADKVRIIANIPTPPPPTATRPPATAKPPPSTATPVPQIATPTVTPSTVPVPGETRLGGSCKSLKEAGLVPEGGWPRGHVNYNRNRDRDDDGWACE